MATERQSPDAILELTNLTGTVSDIQDHPDSPAFNVDSCATITSLTTSLKATKT